MEKNVKDGYPGTEVGDKWNLVWGKVCAEHGFRIGINKTNATK